MSSRVTISAEDFQYLESYQKLSAIALYDTFGRLKGYSVYDSYARQIRAKKMAALKAFEKEINDINNKINQIDNYKETSNQEIVNQINNTMNNYVQKLKDNQDLKYVSKIFNEATNEVAKTIENYHDKLIINYRNEISDMTKSYQNDLNAMYAANINELKVLEHNLASKQVKANEYALAYLNKAQAALQTLEAGYDEHYNNINVINNLKNVLETCRTNIQNGLYEAAMAIAIDVNSQCYQEILNFDLQRQEYNNLLKEATYHIDYLLKYSEERMKLNQDVLDTVNQMTDGKRVSKTMTKKELRYFSPEKKIDLNVELLKTYQAKLVDETNAYTLAQLKKEVAKIKCLYPQVDQAFNDAVAYFGNYLERESFMNSIIDKFEEHGRVFKSMRLGEKENEDDFTKPIFVLFEDESTKSEFMIEINYIGSPDTRLQSEFHVHRIKGDPYNQHENDLTEQLVHQAIDEDNQDAIHGGNGCNRSSIGKLSDDQRILKVRRLM